MPPPPREGAGVRVHLGGRTPALQVRPPFLLTPGVAPPLPLGLLPWPPRPTCMGQYPLPRPFSSGGPQVRLMPIFPHSAGWLTSSP